LGVLLLLLRRKDVTAGANGVGHRGEGLNLRAAAQAARVEATGRRSMVIDLCDVVVVVVVVVVDETISCDE
jgi:hypothetical protein